jgi:hypothetical protein
MNNTDALKDDSYYDAPYDNPAFYLQDEEPEYEFEEDEDEQDEN